MRTKFRQLLHACAAGEQAVEWPLLGAALAFLAAFAWPILDPGLSPSLQRLCDLVTWAAWVAFAIDFAVRLALATERRRYLLRHLHDLAVIALPLLRPLRLLRLVTVIGALNRRAGSSLRGRVVVYVVGATTLLTAVAALAMLDAERNAPGANITTVGDALWWGTTTITTVGYGDRSPRPPRDASSRSDSCSPASLCSVSLPPPWPSWIIDESAKNRGREGGHLGAGRSADLRGPPSQGAAAARPEDSTGYGRRRLARTVRLQPAQATVL